jgi:hypothetical protein
MCIVNAIDCRRYMGISRCHGHVGFDGWRDRKEQSKRWEHDDKRRAEESKPSAVIEIAAKHETPQDMCFACFNLGNNTFFVDRMIVTCDGTPKDIDLSPLVVTPGTWVTIDFDPKGLLGMFGESKLYKEANCVLMLKGATGVVATEPEWFYVVYGSGRIDWFKGRPSDKLPGMMPQMHKILPPLPK